LRLAKRCNGFRQTGPPDAENIRQIMLNRTVLIEVPVAPPLPALGNLGGLGAASHLSEAVTYNEHLFESQSATVQNDLDHALSKLARCGKASKTERPV